MHYIVNIVNKYYTKAVWDVFTMSDENQRDSEEEDDDDDDDSERGSSGGRNGSSFTTFFNSLLSGGFEAFCRVSLNSKRRCN